jgi:flagellar assembly FlgT-like protein/curli production assembly/transport component CsgG
MRSNSAVMLGLSLMMCSFAFAQSARRLAIIEANGPMARSNAAFALAENQVADKLTAKLAGKPGITVIDRASVDKIIKEQNFQNSDRSSSDTAVRIGKLLGAGQIVLVNVYDGGFTTHNEQSGNTTKTIGTQTLRANARLIDVESGVILGEPSSEFQDSVQVSEVSKSNGYQFGAIRVPAKQSTTGGDPKVIQSNEWAKASDAVTTDLATKLVALIGSAPGPKAASAMVAGIANGSVYINQGSQSGIKASDKFKVVREVNVGLNDPATGKPIVQKQTVCVLTIVNVNDTNASGTCAGGLPQSKDVAEPMQ